MNRSGLTLIEVLVATVVLSVGVLGMAAGTGWMIRSAGLTRIETNRAVTLQDGIETVRNISFASIASGSMTEGSYNVSWSVLSQSPNWKLVRFILVGPGRVPGSAGPNAAISPTVADTLEYRINRP